MAIYIQQTTTVLINGVDLCLVHSSRLAPRVRPKSPVPYVRLHSGPALRNGYGPIRPDRRSDPASTSA